MSDGTQKGETRTNRHDRVRSSFRASTDKPASPERVQPVQGQRATMTGRLMVGSGMHACLHIPGHAAATHLTRLLNPPSALTYPSGHCSPVVPVLDLDVTASAPRCTHKQRWPTPATTALSLARTAPAKPGGDRCGTTRLVSGWWQRSKRETSPKPALPATKRATHQSFSPKLELVPADVVNVARPLLPAINTFTNFDPVPKSSFPPLFSTPINDQAPIPDCLVDPPLSRI